MVKLASTVLLATLASAVALQREAAPAHAGDPRSNQWMVFAQHEEKAFRDYRWALTTGDVIENGRKLRDLARSPDFGRQHANCGLAAQTLSYMVTGRYYSARRLVVSADWHRLSDDYARHRRACLADLKLDENEHPLPSWFGR